MENDFCVAVNGVGLILTIDELAGHHGLDNKIGNWIQVDENGFSPPVNSLHRFSFTKFCKLLSRAITNDPFIPDLDSGDCTIHNMLFKVSANGFDFWEFWHVSASLAFPFNFFDERANFFLSFFQIFHLNHSLDVPISQINDRPAIDKAVTDLGICPMAAG